jgi:putative transposase
MKSLKIDIKLLCDIAKVSRGGYYKWLKICNREDRDYSQYLLVRKAFDKGKGKYGWRQVQMGLNIRMNHKRVKRIMKKYGLRAKIRKRNPYKAIMKKTKEHRTFPNQLDRDFNQIEPNKFFCTDITYLPFNNRLAFLSAVKDIASKEIVAWNMSEHIRMDLVLGTIEKMKTYQNALIHSDQGFHFTNPEYIQRVKKLGMKQSMSRKGNCIDNAPIESFFGHLKDDVDYKSCKTFEEVKMLIENYIDYYNNERRQWDLNKMTPVEYRDHLLALNA